MMTALLALPIAAALAAGAGYPAARENYINDFAGVLSQTDAQMLRSRLADVEKQTGVEGTVVTVNSISDYQPGASVESFATGLFNAWGVGNKRRNDGFMVLVAIKDRKMRIELGNGYGTLQNVRMKDIVDSIMVPRFKGGEYSRGIYEGTVAVTDAVTHKVSTTAYYKERFAADPKLIAYAIGVVVLVLIGISCMRSGRTGWGWAFLLAAGALLWWLFQALGKSDGDGSSSDSFGGGSSSGSGGASGSW